MPRPGRLGSLPATLVGHDADQACPSASWTSLLAPRSGRRLAHS